MVLYNTKLVQGFILTVYTNECKRVPVVTNVLTNLFVCGGLSTHHRANERYVGESSMLELLTSDPVRSGGTWLPAER